MVAFGPWQSKVWKHPVYRLSLKSISVEKTNLQLFSIMDARRASSSQTSARAQQGLLCSRESTGSDLADPGQHMHSRKLDEEMTSREVIHLPVIQAHPIRGKNGKKGK